MRIGVMLRHYQQHEGGVKVYTHNLLPRLLRKDSKNQYVLIYQDPKLIGTFAMHSNVEEISVSMPGKILWDQIAVPWIAKKKRLDIIFNLKFAVPFFSKAKKVFVLHGSEFFVIPEAFLWHDRWYFKKFVPLYCRMADMIISVSQAVKQDVIKYTGINKEKVSSVHNGFDPEVFHLIRDPNRLNMVAEKYRLPKRFMLWAGQIYPPKNFGRLIEAFSQIKDEFPHHLVIAGEQRWRAKSDLKLIQKLEIEDRIHFTDWISHENLAVFYNLAELFVFPSLHEGFGIPLLEAMACGCPVLTSKTGAPPEVVDGAAVLVDPLEVSDIANRMREILSNPQLRESMAKKGIEQVKSFSWDRCAEDTLAVLESLAGPK